MTEKTMSDQNMTVAQKSDPFAPPAILYDLPEEIYHELPGVSSSRLKTLLTISPKHMRETPHEGTDALTLGTLAHKMILEPGRVAEHIRVKPEGAGKGSNAAKTMLVEFLVEVTGMEPAFYQDAKTGKPLAPSKQLDAQLGPLQEAVKDLPITIVSQEMYDTATRMRDSVMSKKLVHRLLEDGDAEVTMIAKDPETGLILRSRNDWIPAGHEIIVDLKTIGTDCSYDSFARAIAKYQYHIQDALYRRVYSIATGKPEPAFVFLVVESQPPYDSAFWTIDDEALAAGRNKVRIGIERWKRCEERKFWPGVGYDEGLDDYPINTISVPKWGL